MIRVLLADDQALIRSGIRSLLEAEDDIEVVGEAADGQQAIALAAEHTRTSRWSTSRCRYSTASRRPGRSSRTSGWPASASSS
jgi:CheY-like chemotaxis protein